MRTRLTIWTVVLVAGSAIGARAQDAPMPRPAPPPRPAEAAPVPDTPGRQWIASGFVGLSGGGSADGAGLNYGGSIGRLRHGRIGAELLGNFTPDFHLDNPLLAGRPAVNSYMGNAMFAVPLGEDARWQPFASGGFGGIQLRSDVRNAAGIPAVGATSANETKFGGDIGGGMSAYVDNFGVRADIRYFKASGLSFWTANLGVAVRW